MKGFFFCRHSHPEVNCHSFLRSANAKDWGDPVPWVEDAIQAVVWLAVKLFPGPSGGLCGGLVVRRAGGQAGRLCGGLVVRWTDSDRAKFSEGECRQRRM